jgi:HK97 gp10 family phage protein
VKFTAKMSGAQALKKQLADLSPDIRKGVSAAMARGADRVVRRAQTLVPKRSGQLASTIHRTDAKTDRRGRMYVVIVAGSSATEETGSGGTYQLARLVEFGTVKAPAEPFFFPAFRSQRSGIRTAIRRAIRAAVRRETSSSS